MSILKQIILRKYLMDFKDNFYNPMPKLYMQELVFKGDN